jgi:predicted DNA-binding transcriptional regulator AlpA
MTRNDRTTWPEVLHRTEMATVYGVSVKTVDRMRKDGTLPDRLPGSVPMWSKADVMRWLDSPRERRGHRRAA